MAKKKTTFQEDVKNMVNPFLAGIEGLRSGKTSSQIQREVMQQTNPVFQQPVQNNVKEETTTKAKTPTNPQTPEVFRDSNTGRVSGVSLPDGKTFLGLSPEEVDKLISQYNSKTATPAGAQEVGTSAILQRQQEQNIGLAQQVGMLSPEQQATANNQQNPQLDFMQAGQQGIGNVIPGAIGGAAGGAAIGAFAGGVGAIPGAIIGGIGGAITTFITGARSDLKQQQNEELTTDTQALSNHVKNLKAFITQANQNPALSADALDNFNEQLAYIDRDYSRIKLASQNDLNAFLGVNGASQLAQYVRFNEAGSTRDYLIAQMQSALLNPNPNKNLLAIEDLQTEE